MPHFRALVPGGFYANGTSGPVSVRSNNPGAINGAAWERNFPGFVGNVKYDGKNDTTVFEAPEFGVAAWWTLIKLYRERFGVTTVGGIIKTYGGGQDYSEYVKFVLSRTGFIRSTEINLNDDASLRLLARAMFRYEAGVETPLLDEQLLFGFRIGRAVARGERVPEYSTVVEKPKAHWLPTLLNLLLRLWRPK
jgi:hypothetical protein